MGDITYAEYSIMVESLSAEDNRYKHRENSNLTTKFLTMTKYLQYRMG